MRKFLVFATLMMTLGSLPAAAGGFLRKVEFKRQGSNRSTTSTAFSNLISVDFTSTAAGPVVVHFCGMSFTGFGRSMGYRAHLDGAVFGGGEVFYTEKASSASYRTAHCMLWFKDNVPAGSHSVLIKFRSHSEGLPATSDERRLLVEYNK